MSDRQRKALCQAWFSSARYIDFGKNTGYGTTRCDTGQISYAPGKSTRPADAVREISAICP